MGSEETPSGPGNRRVGEIQQSEILKSFSPQEQETIQYKQQVLSSLAYFIGKDFQIPVELNQPGAGWHWDFGENKIRIDPKDLVEKPMDYLRFVISHEGGHRRISRMEDIPKGVWSQPGFAFMMNAIEDPRNNNFIAEAYPKFREQMELAYTMHEDRERKFKEEAGDKLGQTPRFGQAGFEYIKQWFREARGEEFHLSEDLPDDVREVVQKTLKSAQDSWLRYPSRAEADQGEETIKAYARLSNEINIKKVWPEFQKLVEKDIEDQKMQQAMKDIMKQQGGEGDSQHKDQSQEGQPGQGGQQGVPQDLKDKLTPEEQKELEDSINQAMEKSDSEDGKPQVIDLDSLSDGLKEKIKEHIDSLPEDKKKELEEAAKKALKEFEDEMNDELEGHLADNPDKKEQRDSEAKEEQATLEESKPETSIERTPEEQERISKFKELLEERLAKDANVYEQYRREVLPIINELEQDLREIFIQRRANKWETGFKTGKKIDIKRRIQEKAKGITPMESQAWQKREIPQEKDYAISLLVDLSGSMEGAKIVETFKGLVALSEVLGRLSIRTEILGFNERFYDFKDFVTPMSPEVRERAGGILTSASGGTYIGRALGQASERLSKEKAKEKFILVLTDGMPSDNLTSAIDNIQKNTDQKLVGLGIGHDTQGVEDYFPNGLSVSNVSQMSDKLADLIREVIVNYDSF